MQKTKLKNKSWRKVKLGETGKIVTGKTPPTVEKDYFDGDFPFITPTDITDFNVRYNYVTDRFLSKKWLAKAKNSLIPRNSTCFVCIGSTIGKICLVKEDSFTNQQINTVIVDFRKADFNYIYYLLKYNQRNIVKEYGGGGAAKSIINKSTFENIEVEIPDDINTQKRIADILSAFDDKIELNNKINKILEEMAQAIFKEWFIDFRFPGYEKVKMIDSELGKIPKEWEVKNLSNLFTFIGGAQPPKSEHVYEEREGHVRFVQNRDYTSDSHKTYVRISNRNKLCDELDILMDKYGEVGKVRFGIVGAYNVALAKIEPKQLHFREFLRFYFLQTSIQQIIESTAVASTRGSLNQNTFTGMQIVVPPKHLLERFNELAQTILRKILQTKTENQKLATLRDLLLPKLMSGEIRV